MATQLRRPVALRGAADDDGSTTVEVIFVVPVLMLLLFLLVQMALWAHAAQEAHLAASSATEAAAAQGAGGAPAGVSAAEQILHGPGSDISQGNVAVSIEGDDLVVATVTGRALSMIPGLDLTVSAQLSGPVQEYRVPT